MAQGGDSRARITGNRSCKRHPVCGPGEEEDTIKEARPVSACFILRLPTKAGDAEWQVIPHLEGASVLQRVEQFWGYASGEVQFDFSRDFPEHVARPERTSSPLLVKRGDRALCWACLTLPSFGVIPQGPEKDEETLPLPLSGEVPLA
jgi:hypothetical protein